MQQPSASSSTDEGMQHLLTRHSVILAISVLECVVVPEALVEELADLRFAFAKLLRNYEKQLRHSPKAQEEFVEFLPRLFPKGLKSEDHSFQSHFDTLIEEEVSLFNIHYLKRICAIFPKDVQ